MNASAQPSRKGNRMPIIVLSTDAMVLKRHTSVMMPTPAAMTMILEIVRILNSADSGDFMSRSSLVGMQKVYHIIGCVASAKCFWHSSFIVSHVQEKHNRKQIEFATS